MQEKDESKEQIHQEAVVNVYFPTDELPKGDFLLPPQDQPLLKKIISNKNFKKSSNETYIQNKKRNSKLNDYKQSQKDEKDTNKQKSQQSNDKTRKQVRKVTIIANESANESLQQEKMSVKDTPNLEPQITNVEKIKNFIKLTNFDQYEKKSKKLITSNDSIKQIIDDLVQANIDKQKQLERAQIVLMHVTNAQNENFNESFYFNPDFSNYSIYKLKNNFNSKQIEQIPEESYDYYKYNQEFGVDSILENAFNIHANKEKANLYRKKKGLPQNSDQLQPQNVDPVLQHSTKQILNFSRRNQQLQQTKQYLQDEIQQHIDTIKQSIEETKEKQEHEHYQQLTLKMMEKRTMSQNMEMRKKLHELEQVNSTIKKTNESLESELNAVRLQKKLIRFKKEQINEELTERDNKYSQALNQQNIVQIEVESELVQLIKEYEEFIKREKQIQETLSIQQKQIEVLEKEYEQKITNKQHQQKQQVLLSELDYLITIKLYTDKMEKKVYKQIIFNIIKFYFLNYYWCSLQNSFEEQETEDEQSQKVIGFQEDERIQLQKSNIIQRVPTIQSNQAQSSNKLISGNQSQSSQQFLSNEEEEDSNKNEFQNLEEFEKLIKFEGQKHSNIYQDEDQNSSKNLVNNYPDFTQKYQEDLNISKKSNRNIIESINESDNIINVVSSQEQYNISQQIISQDSDIQDNLDDLEENVHDTSIKLLPLSEQNPISEKQIDDWKESSISSVAAYNNQSSNEQLNNLNVESNENLDYNFSEFDCTSQDKFQIKNSDKKLQKDQNFSIKSISSQEEDDTIKNLDPKYQHLNDISEVQEVSDFQKSLLEKKNKSTRFVEDIIKEDKQRKQGKNKTQKKTQKKYQKKKKNLKKNKLSLQVLKQKLVSKSKQLKKENNLSNTLIESSYFDLNRSAKYYSQDLGKNKKNQKSMNDLQFISKTKRFIENEVEKIYKQKQKRDGSKTLQQRIRQFIDSIDGNIENCFNQLIERYKRIKENLENQQIQQNRLTQLKEQMKQNLEELNAIPLEIPVENLNTINSIQQSSLLEKTTDNKCFFKFQNNTAKTFSYLDNNLVGIRSKTDLQINDILDPDEITEVKEYKQKMDERDNLLTAEIYNLEQTQTMIRLNKSQRILSLFQQNLKIVHFRISRALSNLADKIGNQALQALITRTNSLVNKLNEKANSLLQRDMSYIKIEFSQFEFQSTIQLDPITKLNLIKIFTQQGHIFDCISSVIGYFFPFCKSSISQFIYQFKKGYYLLRFCKKVDILYYISLVQNSVMVQKFYEQPTTAVNDEQKSINQTTTTINGTKTKFGNMITQKLSQLGMFPNLFPNENHYAQKQNTFKQLKLVKPYEQLSQQEQKNIDEIILTELYNHFPTLLARAAQNYYQISIERTNQLIQLISTLQKLVNEIMSNLQKEASTPSQSSSITSLKGIETKKEFTNSKELKLRKGQQKATKLNKKQISQMSKKNSHLDEKDFKKLDQYDFNYGQDWQQRLNNLQLQAYSRNQVRRMNSYMGINKYEEKESLLTIDNINHIIKKNPQNINIKELVKEQLSNLHYIQNPETINLGEEFQNFNSLRKQIKEELKMKERLFIKTKLKSQNEHQLQKLEEIQSQEYSQGAESFRKILTGESIKDFDLTKRSRATSLWQKSLSPIRIINIFSKIPRQSTTDQKKSKLENIIQCSTSNDIHLPSNQNILLPINKPQNRRSTKYPPTIVSLRQDLIPIHQITKQRVNEISPLKKDKIEGDDANELMDIIKKIVHYKNDFKKAKQSAIDRYNKENIQQKNEHFQQKKQLTSQGQQDKNSPQTQQQQNIQQQEQMNDFQQGSYKQISQPTQLTLQQQFQLQQQQQQQQLQQQQLLQNGQSSKNHLEKVKVKKSFAAYFKRKQYEKQREIEDQVLNLYKHSDNYYQQRNQDITNLSMDDTYYNYLNIEQKKQVQELPHIGSAKYLGDSRRDALQYTSIWNIINRLQAQKKLQNLTKIDNNNQNVNINDQDQNNKKLFNQQTNFNSPLKKSPVHAHVESFKQAQIKIVKHQKVHLKSKSKSPNQKQKDIQCASPTSPNVQSSSAVTTAPRSLSPIGVTKYSTVTQSKFKIEQGLPKIKSKHSSSSPLRKSRKKSFHQKTQNLNQD